jgi:hypothetical protein
METKPQKMPKVAKVRNYDGKKSRHEYIKKVRVLSILAVANIVINCWIYLLIF